MTKGSVLVASDCAAVRVLVASLATQAGMAAVQDDASEPAELAAQVNRYRPLLAIVEVPYPGRDERELRPLAALRSALGTSLETALIAVTTSDDDELHERVQRVGVEALFMMPLRSASFRAALAWHAHRAEIARRTVGTFYAVDASDAVVRIDPDSGRPPSGSTLALVHAAQEIAAQRIAQHAERVARYTFELAVAIGLPEDRAHGIAAGGLLHDIGHALGGDAHKGDADGGAGAHARRSWNAGRRSLRDVSDATQHVTVGLELLERGRVALPLEARLAVAHHHERWAGGGYPTGLRGNVIPLAARIVAVADRYDRSHINLSSGSGDTAAERLALAQVHDAAGTVLDPELADAFVALRRRGLWVTDEASDMPRASD